MNTSVSPRAAIPNRNVALLMAAIVTVGLLFLVSNLDLPIVRNGFAYAKSAQNIIDHGFNPLPVAGDPALSHRKPIGFSLFSVPFVALWGPNTGAKVASFLGTAFFLFVAHLFFVRLNRRAGIDPRFVPLELALLFFNPLVFYQFWSAYSDSLFAGLVLLAFVLADVIVTEPERDTRSHILLLGLVIYAAILARFYGLILGIAVPLYLLLHLRSFLKRSARLRSKLTLLVLVFGVLGVAAVLALLGRNPTLSFGGGGMAGYLAQLTNPSADRLVASILLVAVALLLNFHFSLLFLGIGRRKRESGRAWPLAPTCFAAIYVVGLLQLSGTSYNMRFFLPVFPFLVVAIVSGMLSTAQRARRAVLGAYFGTAIFLTLNYNVEPVHTRLRALNEDVIDPVLDRARRLDNLRLDQHVALSRRIEQINEIVESDGVLYWTSRYYGAATHGVIHDLGVRDDIVLRYAGAATEIPPSSSALYVAGYRTPLRFFGVEDHYVVSALAPGLFRLVPMRFQLASLAKDYFDPGETVSLAVEVAGPASAQVARVEFVMDSLVVGVDAARPFEHDLQETREGRHEVWARGYDDRGNVVESGAVAFFVGLRALERSIVRSEDDAQEWVDAPVGLGGVRLASPDLELIENRGGDQVVGLRFTDLRIPPGARIAKAFLQFTPEERDSGPADLTIQAELAGDAAVFENSRGNISSRNRTAASVEWSPGPWIRSAAVRTPDISALVQEVVTLPDWQHGNAMVLLISGSDSGERDVWSYDGRVRAWAPRLYVELAEGDAPFPGAVR